MERKGEEEKKGLERIRKKKGEVGRKRKISEYIPSSVESLCIVSFAILSVVSKSSSLHDAHTPIHIMSTVREDANGKGE